MVATVNAYWVAFAKSGDPNAGGRPRMSWPAYTAQNDTLLDLHGGRYRGGPDPWEARLDVTERVAGHPESDVLH